MSDLQYRTCQHSGEKVFAEQSRLLTYRGNTYRTRVFQAQQSVNGNNSNVVELFEGGAPLERQLPLNRVAPA